MSKHLQKLEGTGQDESASDLEDLGFSTFDYSDGKATPAYLAQRKHQNVSYSLLKKVEEEKAQLDQLKSSKEGAQLVREKKMEVALRRVQGEKVKDDPSKLRKTLKRKDRQVEKSREKIADRKRTEKAQQYKKTKQREDNIKARAEAKKANQGKRGKPVRASRSLQGKEPSFSPLGSDRALKGRRKALLTSEQSNEAPSSTFALWRAEKKQIVT